MEYQGRVRNGVVIFEGTPPLEEGTRVRIAPVEPERASLGDKLLNFAGKARGLPPDASST